MATQRGGAFRDFLFQLRIEVSDVVKKVCIFKRCGRQLGHFVYDVLVMQGEFAFIFIAQLQQPNVLPFPPAQRHGKPAAHGRVFVGVLAESLPTRMRFQLRLR